MAEMKEYTYQVQGSADPRPNIGTIKAENEKGAMQGLKAIYGGNVELKLITPDQFGKLKQAGSQVQVAEPEQPNAVETKRPE